MRKSLLFFSLLVLTLILAVVLQNSNSEIGVENPSESNSTELANLETSTPE